MTFVTRWGGGGGGGGVPGNMKPQMKTVRHLFEEKSMKKFNEGV